jgi:hypothetical protein
MLGLKWLRKMGKPRKPYDKRSDIDKIRAQWKKLSGLHGRDEPSAAIVRCATAAEIAANLAIRKEFEKQTTFDAVTVDGFLVWANGLSGKMNRLLLPLRYGGARTAEFKRLAELAQKIHDIRNDVVHRGTFSTAKRADDVIEKAKEFVETLVGRYEKRFKL